MHAIHGGITVGGHRQPSASGRHVEPPTVERDLDVPPRPTAPSAVLPTGSRGPATGSRGPATGSRGPATGSRGPATGSRGPATGSRRAPGRQPRWLPIALAIWIASFLAVPAAVLVHQAVSGDETPVVEAGETQDEAAPGSGQGSDSGAAGDVADPATTSGATRPGASAVAGVDDPADGAPGADVVVPGSEVLVPGQVVVSGTVVPVGAPGGAAAAAASSAAASRTPGASGGATASTGTSAAGGSSASSTATSSTAEESPAEPPPVEESREDAPLAEAAPAP